jgi:hypothetical protein
MPAQLPRLPITGDSGNRPFIAPSVKRRPVSSGNGIFGTPRRGGALVVFASVIVNLVEVGLASSVILLFALFEGRDAARRA